MNAKHSTTIPEGALGGVREPEAAGEARLTWVFPTNEALSRYRGAEETGFATTRAIALPEFLERLKVDSALQERIRSEDTFFDPFAWIRILTVAVQFAEILKQQFGARLCYYIMGGSLIRGEADPNSDCDTFAGVDDPYPQNLWHIQNARLCAFSRTLIEPLCTKAGISPGRIDTHIHLTRSIHSAMEKGSFSTSHIFLNAIPIYDPFGFVKLMRKKAQLFRESPKNHVIQYNIREALGFSGEFRRLLRGELLDNLYRAYWTHLAVLCYAHFSMVTCPVKLTDALSRLQSEGMIEVPSEIIAGWMEILQARKALRRGETAIAPINWDHHFQLIEALEELTAREVSSPDCLSPQQPRGKS